MQCKLIINIKKQVDINQCKYVCIKLVRACWENWQYALTMQVPFNARTKISFDKISSHLPRSSFGKRLEKALYNVVFVVSLAFWKSNSFDFRVGSCKIQFGTSRLNLYYPWPTLFTTYKWVLSRHTKTTREMGKYQLQMHWTW